MFLGSFLVLLLVVSGSFGVQSAEAQAVTFPPGCSSALGYSATTGSPCNGTNTATARFMTGCTTALGYSATTGAPCSGASVAIQWLAGCSSTIGYSSVDGAPCNGTMVATPVVFPPTAPGLPTTGAGGMVMLNTILLLSSLALAAAGSLYLFRSRKLLR